MLVTVVFIKTKIPMKINITTLFITMKAPGMALG